MEGRPRDRAGRPRGLREPRRGPAGAVRGDVRRALVHDRARARRRDPRAVRGSRRRVLRHGDRPRAARHPPQGRPGQRHAVGRRGGHAGTAAARRVHRRLALPRGRRAGARRRSRRSRPATRPRSRCGSRPSTSRSLPWPRSRSSATPRTRRRRRSSRWSRGGYAPNRVVALRASEDAPTSIPLLEDRTLVKGRPAAYVCRGFACRLPVTDPTPSASSSPKWRASCDVALTEWEADAWVRTGRHNGVVAVAVLAVLVAGAHERLRGVQLRAAMARISPAVSSARDIVVGEVIDGVDPANLEAGNGDTEALRVTAVLRGTYDAGDLIGTEFLGRTGPGAGRARIPQRTPRAAICRPCPESGSLSRSTLCSLLSRSRYKARNRSPGCNRRPAITQWACSRRSSHPREDELEGSTSPNWRTSPASSDRYPARRRRRRGGPVATGRRGGHRRRGARPADARDIGRR